MPKRKREQISDKDLAKNAKFVTAESLNGCNQPEIKKKTSVTIQIVTGSYEKVLHGFTATIPSTIQHEPASKSKNIVFSDTFLFAAHTSSIRALTVSPPSSSTNNKRILASGGTDERIRLYQISSIAPDVSNPTKTPRLPNLSSSSSTAIIQSSTNRELGSLLHHSRSITRLSFPNKTKLFSAAEDNTIAITRVRDWTMLSSIKAPVPKPIGRPSGDTASPGEVPAGVNDFAIHPSMKLMISVGKGEKCMRLWNLVTGKKAGVLSFDKSLLSQLSEGRFINSGGEGLRVIWSPDGEMFVIAFERAAVVFGMDCTARAIVKPKPETKVHELKFLPLRKGKSGYVLALSTEDGRLTFFDVETHVKSSTDGNDDADDADEENDDDDEDDDEMLPVCPCIGQIASTGMGTSNRIKDFEVLQLSDDKLAFITASSDGEVRVWYLDQNSFKHAVKNDEIPLVGEILGSRSTGNRLTCMTAFIMNDADREDDTKALSVTPEQDDVSEDSWDGVDDN